MIRSEISDDRCQVKVEGELGRIAFEFAQLTSNLAANMPAVLLKQAFEDGLYINEHGMKAFEKKMEEDIEKFENELCSEESETEDEEDDEESDRDDFKKFVAATALADMIITLLRDRNDKTDKH